MALAVARALGLLGPTFFALGAPHPHASILATCSMLLEYNVAAGCWQSPCSGTSETTWSLGENATMSLMT
ncbi:predicted protein [Pyrenophora tritici-repentis Pt-1C-BFP]|uniref:Secreted protein n=1 Tax=Pyrenophora tritici-repentis (strain Pt-1C-BFP) TaxID=426418 RepID=B2WJB0_PYRTR|nr:uncharacterized protein PTRG_10069 [Pyrenophora tritici-repentis Pt-1C-BFP]EDU43120.1 predicted protein [Pyrenophora tritici-repentis Pt-1C-BFP]